MIIAVDGPLAAGKGTIAKALASHYGLPFMDTGKLYRGTALRVLEAGGDPSDDEQALQAGQCRGAVLQRLGTGLHEGRSQQQVFGWVAAQAQFRRQHQARALLVGAAGTVDDAFAVASQVAYRRVDLRQGHFHRGFS